jgi:hypothetical protein
MKKAILQPLYVLIFLLFLGATLYAMPLVLHALADVSYKYVILFLLLIFASNVLAKIAKAYINL